VPPGFKRDELKPRYDVPVIVEDEWHTYSGQKTLQIVRRELSNFSAPLSWVLNAGAGIYEFGGAHWYEVSLDLFTTPIRTRPYRVCANVQTLPFPDKAFDCVLCVGEVLAYCDPAKAISEFARVLASSGLLICDFGSSRSFRRWFTASYGRAADLIVEDYNGTPERTWVYDPKYVRALLVSSGFHVRSIIGIHTWSSLGRRLGMPTGAALTLQKNLGWIPLPHLWGDLTTIVASRDRAEKSLP
jgi:SAM-dependent methyltransferase